MLYVYLYTIYLLTFWQIGIFHFGGSGKFPFGR